MPRVLMKCATIVFAVGYVDSSPFIRPCIRLVVDQRGQIKTASMGRAMKYQKEDKKENDKQRDEQ